MKCYKINHKLLVLHVIPQNAIENIQTNYKHFARRKSTS